MKSVLIVDDSMFMRYKLKGLLEYAGLLVIGEAEDGKSAVEKYKELRPDLVTLDITMPEMNGVEALKQIKDFDPDATIIMISALGQDRYLKEAIVYGAKSFLVKPFKDEVVLETIRMINR